MHECNKWQPWRLVLVTMDSKGNFVEPNEEIRDWLDSSTDLALLEPLRWEKQLSMFPDDSVPPLLRIAMAESAMADVMPYCRHIIVLSNDKALKAFVAKESLQIKVCKDTDDLKLFTNWLQKRSVQASCG